MSCFVSDPLAVKAAIQPFLDGNLALWKGLPRIAVETLSSAIGKPTKIEEAGLGWYPADRYSFAVKCASDGIAAYVRNREVILVEAFTAPSLPAIDDLGKPTAILPHEILVQDAYVHEYLYCERGLVLSIAEPFQEGQPSKIVRCRGIRPLISVDEFGPEFFQAFEDRTVWR